jgi:hypothetical protein
MPDLSWITFGIAAILAMLLFLEWRRGIRVSCELTHLLMLVMLDEEEHRLQQQSLIRFIKSTRCDSSGALAGMVSNKLVATAARRWSATTGLTMTLMWSINRASQNSN